MLDDQDHEDLRAAVDERLAASRETSRRRRAGRRERLTELHQRRQHGLRARHAAKLARLEQDSQPDTHQEGRSAMTETAITDNSTISTDDLNRFETPRDPWGDPTGEPVPFTKPELRAIGAYNTRTAGIPDCFDQMDTNGFRDVPGEGFTFDDNVKRIKEHFVYLRQWLEALHDLGMDLGFNLGKPLSDTATRLFENEEQRFKRAHDDTRDAALHFFIGDAADVYQL